MCNIHTVSVLAFQYLFQLNTFVSNTKVPLRTTKTYKSPQNRLRNYMRIIVFIQFLYVNVYCPIFYIKTLFILMAPIKTKKGPTILRPIFYRMVSYSFRTRAW